jgi:hypothetical protein
MSGLLWAPLRGELALLRKKEFRTETLREGWKIEEYWDCVFGQDNFYFQLLGHVNLSGVELDIILYEDLVWGSGFGGFWIPEILDT